MDLTFLWPAMPHAGAKLPGRYKGTRKKREPRVIRKRANCRLCGKRLPQVWEGVICRNCSAEG
jgi:hypothetical protein